MKYTFVDSSLQEGLAVHTFRIKARTFRIEARTFRIEARTFRIEPDGDSSKSSIPLTCIKIVSNKHEAVTIINSLIH